MVEGAQLTRSVPPGIARWKVCPVCAGPLAFVQGEPDADPHAVCQSCGAEHYANPKPTVSVLAENAAGELLLGRRAIPPFRHMWDTPGGFMEDGEAPEATALRELREETGLTAEVIELLGAWRDTYGDGGASTVNLFYRVRIRGSDDATAASDVAQLRWFAVDDLPADDEIAFACVPSAVAAWRERVQVPS
jgi:ADP-ribose pyrophosphatase YjhB (NUDIX family)